MVSIDKKEFTSRDDARAQKREEALKRKEALTEYAAEDQIARYQTVEKKERYTDDLELLKELKPGFRGEIDYKLIGNKTLSVTGEGEITRERGYRTKIRKVTRLDEETGEAYVARREKENGRKRETADYDRNGMLTSKFEERKNGRYREKWERDEAGNLMRTAYYSNRLRDGHLRAVKEEMTGPAKREDGKTYRLLTRTKGSKKKVFERDEAGKLKLVERTTRTSSMRVRKAPDGKSTKIEIEKANGLFSKSYKTRLDENGKEIGRDVTAHRRLLNKRSATYDKESGEMATAKHTVGKLYKSEATFAGEDFKIVSRKILGLKLRTRREGLSDAEREAQASRVKEARQHRQAWTKDAPQEQPKIEATEKDVPASTSVTDAARDPPPAPVREPEPRPARPESLSDIETASTVSSDSRSSSLSSGNGTTTTTPDTSRAPSRSASFSSTKAPPDAQALLGTSSLPVSGKTAGDGGRTAPLLSQKDQAEMSAILTAPPAVSRVEARNDGGRTPETRETQPPPPRKPEGLANPQALLGAPDPSKPARQPALRTSAPTLSAKQISELASALGAPPTAAERSAASTARSELKNGDRGDRDRGSPVSI
ncbi:hypothetical protein ACFFP0_23765 [Rhizobium puerariae]|uniref:Effector protein n=1 Tax=Rhizobium puerariae TaxID=1585791 RepID=A0ABV6APU4_9HYPH